MNKNDLNRLASQGLKGDRPSPKAHLKATKEFCRVSSPGSRVGSSRGVKPSQVYNPPQTAIPKPTITQTDEPDDPAFVDPNLHDFRNQGPINHAPQNRHLTAFNYKRKSCAGHQVTPLVQPLTGARHNSIEPNANDTDD